MTQSNFDYSFVSIKCGSKLSSCVLKKIFSCLLVMVILFAFILPGTIHCLASEPWSEWRGSKEHIGVSSARAPESAALLWKSKTEDQIWSSPVFYNDCVIIGSDDSKLYCFDSANGQELWKFTTAGSVQATPLIIDNHAYFGSLDGTFYCLVLPELGQESQGAQESWTYDCGASIVSSAHVFKDSVIFGCHNNNLYRLSLSGSYVWDSDLGSQIWASPLIDEDNAKAYIGTIEGDFFCINLYNGSVNWVIDVGQIYSSGCLSNGIIYLSGGISQRLYAINADNGSIIWFFDVGYDAYSTPSVFNERLYFGSFQYAWCLPREDPNSDGEINASEVIWSTQTYESQGGSSPLVTEKYVYIGSDDGNLYCLDTANGNVVWNYTTGGFVYSSPALYRQALYFGSCDNYMYCFGNRSFGLYVQLKHEVKEIKSNETLEIEITVVDQNESLVQGAILDIALSAGEFKVIDDNDDQIITGSSGSVKIIFTPPPVSSRSKVDITVIAEKSGVKSAQANTQITVEPGKTSQDVSSDVVDLNEKRMPYIAILLIFIVIDIVLAFGILKMRNVKTKKEIK